VNAISQKLSSGASSSEALNKNVLDNDSRLRYDSPITQGGAMTSSILEYGKNKAKISITGGTHFKRKMLKRAARWMLGYALGNRLANNITLKIRIDETLINTRFYGSVIWEDNNSRPRKYDMEICNYLTDRTMYKVLAHEIVHIRQYATGDLKDLATQANYCKWKNELVQADGPGKVSYFHLPWEIEARRDQEVILREWKETHGYHFRQKTGELYSERNNL
jgi:hypothetical protein